MKLVPYHGVLLKEYVGEILNSFDEFQVVPSLSGVPDYFGRNKISSGGDLSHYSSASLY